MKITHDTARRAEAYASSMHNRSTSEWTAAYYAFAAAVEEAPTFEVRTENRIYSDELEKVMMSMTVPRSPRGGPTDEGRKAAGDHFAKHIGRYIVDHRLVDVRVPLEEQYSSAGRIELELLIKIVKPQ